jgi:predicted deacylase
MKRHLFLPLAGVLLLGVAACSNPRSDPPGTAAQRSYDRNVGTNTSGAYPAQSDGRPGNPPGSATERAYDRATDSNTSGAYPRNR